jgi:hypothetical protein
VLASGFSPAEIKLYQEGPFPRSVDPWAEAATYYHSIHGSMIDALLEHLNPFLLARGYFAARERSLQIIEGRARRSAGCGEDLVCATGCG